MGSLMRQYWLPFAISNDLEADGAPLRVRLLGENLVAFRTTGGKVGLVDHFCAHRGTSLFFGRNEEDGLRCSYHGWKFDITGACIDQPGEPAENNFKAKVSITAYPCEERSGIIWTYMGPRETPPALPALEANLGVGVSSASRTLRYCNWLQALEGDIDTLHSEYLHGPAVVDVSKLTPGTGMYYRHRLRDQFKYEVRDTEFGTSYGAYRPAEEGTTYWRLAHFLFPCFTMTPTPAAGSAQTIRMWVPVDDDHVMFWSVDASPQERASHSQKYQEDTSDWLGKHRPVQRVENDYLVDREDQKTESYTGIGGGFVMHDTMATESMGTTMDRSREHLGVSDAMIIRTRKRLLDALHALEDGNVAPPGVDDPLVYGTRSGWMILPEGADWWEGSAELRTAFIAKRDESDATAALTTR
jgi:phthalate 4,5-dioxygenase